MRERLKQIRTQSGLNSSDFAKKIGVDRSAYYRAEAGTQALSDKYVQKICEIYPIISYEWLKLGKGSPPIFDRFPEVKKTITIENHVPDAGKKVEKEPNNPNYPHVNPKHIGPAERLKYIFTTKNLSQVDVAEKLGIKGQGYISSILSGRRGIGSVMAQKIVTAFPEVSLDWLMNGKGEAPIFIKQQHALFANEPAPVYNIQVKAPETNPDEHTIVIPLKSGKKASLTLPVEVSPEDIKRIIRFTEALGD